MLMTCYEAAVFLSPSAAATGGMKQVQTEVLPAVYGQTTRGNVAGSRSLGASVAPRSLA
jgi:hypothetical protein